MTASAETVLYASTTEYLNLRKGASTNTAIQKILGKNVTLTILDRSNAEWLKVRTSDGMTGYCSCDYLDIVNDAKTTDYLNFRKGAGTGYDIIRTLDPSTKVDILRFCGSSWAYVKLSDGQKGYVCSDYLSYFAVTSTTAVNPDAVDSVTLSSTSKKAAVGSSFTLTATATSGGTFSWSSSDTKIASVTSKGLVTGLKEGTAVVTATDSKTKKAASCTVKVVSSDVTSITLPQSSKTIQVSQSFTLTPTVVPSGKTVTYRSSNSAVATVSSLGLVKGISGGTASITVSDASGAVSASMKVTVQNPDSITISQSSASCDMGSSVVLRATSSNNTSITWSSSNANVASVRNGVVSGLKAGTATITASDASGKVSAKCKVTVHGVSSSGVSLSRYATSTTAGKTVYIRGYSTRRAEWGSSDSNIATVSEGFILAKNPGRAAITYTDTYGNTAVCVIIVERAAPIRFTYSSPNSALLNQKVKLIAITDRFQSKVNFVVDENGTKVNVSATERKAEGNTFVWTGYYTAKKAGTFQYTAQGFNGTSWRTCTDGKADIFVSSKTDKKTTALDPLRASDEMIRFVGEKEGFVSYITYDTLANNLPTIAHGYVVWEGESFYNGLTKSEGYALLVSAMNKDAYSSKVNDMLINNRVRFNQQQFDALVSFSYNLGTGWTSSSDLKDILLDSYGKVADGTVVTGTVTSDSGLNLRKEATTSAEVIGVLGYQENVTLVSTTKYNSVWYKVKTSSGKVGFCSGTYLRLNAGSTTGRDLNYVNRNALINEMLAYHHAGNVCYYGLLYRRADELEMFLYGDYAADGRSNKHNFPNPPCISFP